MKAVQLSVDDEFAAVGDLYAVLFADIAAKKSITEISADALPKVIAAVSGYSAFAADIKKVDNQLYLLKAILESVEPKPAPAA